MKTLKFIFENSEPIVMMDDDNTSIEEIMDSIPDVFNSNYVQYITTTNGAITFRPNKLVAVLVEEEPEAMPTSLMPEKEMKDLEKLLDEEPNKKEPPKTKRKRGRPRKKPVEEPKPVPVETTDIDGEITED